jgi:hypothetical protein
VIDQDDCNAPIAVALSPNSCRIVTLPIARVARSI